MLRKTEVRMTINKRRYRPICYFKKNNEPSLQIFSRACMHAYICETETRTIYLI